MLTRELAIAEYDRGRILPDRLPRKTHRPYIDYADRMLAAYRDGLGRTRRELHRAVSDILARAAIAPPDASTPSASCWTTQAFTQRDCAGRAAALRGEVFHAAAANHPLVRKADRLFECEEHAVKAAIAEKLDRPWPEIDRELFADVIDFHRLREFPAMSTGRPCWAIQRGPSAGGAVRSHVDDRLGRRRLQDDRPLCQLARLMQTIPSPSFGGQGSVRPTSRKVCPSRNTASGSMAASVLRDTRRYAAMARFLPALVACRNWRMHAVIATRRKGWTVGLDLSSR